MAPSFGGMLTSAELNALIARKGDIEAFIDAGNGLFASAECEVATFSGCRGAAASVPEPKFGDKYSGRGARIARREERAYWA